ncbi:MAG TPA: redoxin domain-containing protein [Actinomycetota bacterium]|nr:redoxin domain-containing protein [Actinomycetota bacterium]
MRRLLWLAPLAAVLAVSGVALFRASPQAELLRPAPAFSLPVLRNPDARMGPEDLRGRPAVLNFWASWCTPCRDEAPELARAAAEHRGVAFLGVNIRDGRDEATRYEDEFEIRYPSVRDATGRTTRSYRVTGAPETFFLDPQGRVVGHFIGAFAPGQLDQIVSELAQLRPGEVLRITGRGETRPIR